MKLACEQVRETLSLMLYGELSFTEEEALQAHLAACADCRAAWSAEQRWHEELAVAAVEPPAGLLVHCRRQLRSALPSTPVRGRVALWLSSLNWGLTAKPAMGLALVALGFFGARLPLFNGQADSGSFAAGANLTGSAAHVRFVEADPAGNVRMVVDETRPRIVTGRADDPEVQRWLLAATREAGDPGLRAETVALLQGGAEALDVRRALLAALEGDPNAGVRLKAIEGLRRHAGEPDTRQALMRVLNADDNPGIRTQAIDLLTESSPRALDAQMVGMLQQLMRREENGYIRQRCEKALRMANASAEIF